jgi:hypothetical protein
MTHLIADLRYAWRGFMRTPAFTAAALITLTLGILASTATFSLAQAVLLPPLPRLGERLMEEPHRTRTSMRSLLVLLSLGAAFSAAGQVTSPEPGTLGLALNQLYSDQQATKRGALMVRRVEAHSAAADAGIEAGNLILAVDGDSVFNASMSDVVQRLAGPVGSSITLSVVQADGSLQKMTLTRKPYLPHLNPRTDPFSYVIPGNWQMDRRYSFPLEWAPSVAHKGFEDLSFVPGFDDVASPEYHSYLILWWLDGTVALTADTLQTEMAAYFRGLAEQRGRNNHFTPNLSFVTAQYAASLAGPASFGGARATSFNGKVAVIDRHGNVVSLYSEVTSAQCSADNTAVYFAMSKEPRPAALWEKLDRVRDTFKCER